MRVRPSDDASHVMPPSLVCMVEPRVAAKADPGWAGSTVSPKTAGAGSQDQLPSRPKLRPISPDEPTSRSEALSEARVIA